MLDNLSNGEKVVAAIIGLLVIGGLLENAPGLIILLIIFGVLYARRDQSNDTGSYTDYEEDDSMRRITPEPVRRERPSSAEQIHSHALRAVRRAGIDPNDVKVLPVNIGLLSYKDENDPVINSTRPIDDNVDYIQPFVELRIPVTAKGRLRFEIFDNNRHRVFMHTDEYTLERGRNLIMPATRLPIHDEQEMDGRWEMRITADGVTLARHVFEWQPADEDSPRVAEDGEISSELRAYMVETRFQSMSLDELLAPQEEATEDDTPDYLAEQDDPRRRQA